MPTVEPKSHKVVHHTAMLHKNMAPKPIPNITNRHQYTSTLD